MKTLRKSLALLVGAVMMLAVLVVGVTLAPAHASTMDEFVANANMDLDFQNTWAQPGLSVDLIEGDKVLIRGEKGEIADSAWGWGGRITNNYRQRLNGATFDADVYMLSGNWTTIYYGINPSGGAAGEYWDGGGLNIAFQEKGGSDVEITVGWWKMNYGMWDENDSQYKESEGVTKYGTKTVAYQDGKINVKSLLTMNDDESWTLTLTIDDGEPWEIAISKALWYKNSNNTTGYLGVGMFPYGVKAVKVVFNDYSDPNRKSYLNDEDLEAEFDALDALESTYEAAKALSEKPTLSNASDMLYGITVNKDTVLSNEEMRRMEQARATWYYENTKALLDKLYADDAASYKIVAIGVSVNYFAAKAETIKTERDVEAVEKLKRDVDYDTLDGLMDEGVDGVEEILDKYNVADGKLAAKKDEFVVMHLEEFENAVKDLSTNEKMKAAAELQKAVIISNAKRENRAAYTERYNTASNTLKSNIANFAGDLAKKWDIHNVTFIQANKYNEIKYSASDYYDNDSSNDVGITLKSKVKLDGLSFEFTVNSGDYHPDSWFGFFITAERTIFVSAAEVSTGLNESRGVITLVKPFAADPDAGKSAFTQVRMGYPNLYGNETMDIPTLDCDLYGNTLKFEFKKEVGEDDELYYNVYVTVTDEDEEVVVARKLFKTMLASTIDAELDDNGMGYLTFGSCDKTLVGVEATIHTINGKAAATFGEDIDDGPATPGKPGTGDQPGTSDQPGTGTPSSTSKKKKGCGSAVGDVAPVAVALGLLALGTSVVFIRRKKVQSK